MSRQLIVQADGGSRGNPGPAGFGAVVSEAGTGRVLAERSGYLGQATNNVAEYHGLIAGIKAAMALDPSAELDIRLDSKLLVCQMDGSWKIKSPQLAELAAQARAALGAVKARFTWVPRAENTAADALANQAMDQQAGLPAAQPPKQPRGTQSRSGHGATCGDAELEPAARSPRLDGELAGVDVADAPVAAQAVALAQRSASGSQSFGQLDQQPTTVIMVRHGMTPLTVQNGFAGATLPGAALSEQGWHQARGAAAELRRMLDLPWAFLPTPQALYASPTIRTRQTAQPLAEALGLEVLEAPGWIEEDFGLWDGLTKDQVTERWPGVVERWFADSDFQPPGGESRAAVGRRVWSALNQLVAAHPGQCVVVVTHTLAIRAALGAALGAPPAAWFGFRVAPASINIIRLWERGHSEIVCTNRTVAA